MPNIGTPGPWTAERGNVGGKHPLFVVCNADTAFRPLCDADAHLIAAAPELYAALQALDAVLEIAGPLIEEAQSMAALHGDPYTGPSWEHERIAARAALAKARGEQPA
jgi:hypothetical protein